MPTAPAHVSLVLSATRLFALLAWSAVGSAGPAIDQWVNDLQKSGSRVYIAQVRYDPQQNTVTLAEDTAGYAQLAEFLQQPDFVRQFVAAQALTVSRRTPEGFEHLVFINVEQARDFQDDLDPLLAHELGHAWITAQGYALAVYNKGPAGCLSIHAADAVQHILIRKEMARRGIDPLPSWIRTLDRAVAQWQEHPLPPDLPSCERLQAASQWIDVRLGMQDGQWENQALYEGLLRKAYPEMERVVLELSEFLQKADVADRAVYKDALGFVVHRFQRLADSTRSLKINQ